MITGRIQAAAAIPKGKNNKPKKTAIAAGVSDGFAVTDDGLYAWEGNYFGQLGISGVWYSLTPINVPGEANAIDVGAAEDSIVAVH